jgi:hypothetical protein
MNCTEYRLIVAAHADGLLAGGEQASAREHEAVCADCASLRCEQEKVARLLRERAPRHALTPELRERVLASLQHEAASAGRLVPLFGRPVMRRAVLAGAVAAGLVLALLPLRRPAAPDLLAAMARDVRAAHAGEIQFALRSDDIERIRSYYASAPIDFSNPLADLTPMGFRPVGAALSRVGNVDTSLTLYQSPAGRVVCRRFRAGAIPLPDGGEEIAGAVFHTVNGLTVRVERIGDTVCAMATDIPRDEFVQLLAAGHH